MSCPILPYPFTLPDRILDQIAPSSTPPRSHLPKPLDTPLLYKMIRKFLKDDKKAANMDEAVIRPIRKEEYPYLEDFLYDAIYLPDNTAMPSRDIIRKPELAVYIEDFGGPDDFCLVAERGGVPLIPYDTAILQIQYHQIILFSYFHYLESLFSVNMIRIIILEV